MNSMIISATTILAIANLVQRSVLNILVYYFEYIIFLGVQGTSTPDINNSRIDACLHEGKTL
jgi:hypothetical protein